MLHAAVCLEDKNTHYSDGFTIYQKNDCALTEVPLILQKTLFYEAININNNPDYWNRT